MASHVFRHRRDIGLLTFGPHCALLFAIVVVATYTASGNDDLFGQTEPAPHGQADPNQLVQGKSSVDADDLDSLLEAADKDVSQLAKVSVAAPALQTEVTTVSRQASTVGKTPAAVYVVTSEMIERSGARRIPDVLRLVPGVNVAQINANRWAVSIRGFNGTYANKLLVQIDGRSVYNPVFSGVLWDHQDLLLENIDRIEVIRGPGAAVWGANAVNGVINIVTKQASDTQGLFLQGGGGSEERDFGAVRYGGKLGNSLYYRFYGKWDERNSEWADPNAGDASRMGRGGFRMDWKLRYDTTFTFQGDFYDGSSGLVYNAVAPPPQFQVTGLHSNQTPQGRNLLTRYSRKISDESDWAVQLYWDRTQFADEPPNYPDYFQSCDTFDLDFQHRFPLGRRHSLIWGFGYRNTRNVTKGNPTLYFDPAIRSFGLISYFIQDEITLAEDKLYLTLGSKFEHNDFTGFEYQPTARLLYSIDDRRVVWGAVSRAVRTPSVLDQDSRGSFPLGEYVPFHINIQGSRTVKSEQLLAYEIGYRAQPIDPFWWDFTVFYNDYEDLVTYLPGSPFVVNTYANAMRGDTYGFEVAGTYQVRPGWKLGSGYSFLVMNLQGVGAEVIEGESPQNQVYMQSSCDLSKSWRLDATWRYVDSLRALDGSTVPKYVVMDVRLAWTPNEHWEFEVVGRNLYEQHHLEFIPPNFYPSEVRSEVYGMATCRF